MSESRTWVDVQKRTFTGWANNFLKERMMKIHNIETDFGDGILLINLLEVISNKSFAMYNKNAKTRFQKVENTGFAVKFIQNEGLKLVGIGPEDIVDGKLKLILGLIWTLILRYQIQNIEADDSNSPKAALLEWVKKRVEPYGVQVANFDKSWQDGRALSALTDSLAPGVLPFDKISHDPFTDVNKAMDVAESEFSIPKIMDPNDLVNIPDDLSIMTYVSYFRDYALEADRRNEESRLKEEERKKRRADPSHTYAHGPGVTNDACFANDVAMFTIQAVNYHGESLTHGGELGFKVNVVGAHDNTPVEAVVTDKKDGTYHVAYMPTAPGQYNVEITLDGHQIKDSPHHVKIDGAEAHTSTADGPGVTSGESHTGKPAVFTIHARDSNSKDLKHGGDPFEVIVAGPEGEAVQTDIVDNGDGTYTVTYQPTAPGAHNVEVSLRGKPISGGPFAPVVYHATPENSYAEGPGLEHSKALQPAEFTIHAVDVDGNKLQVGGDPFAVLVEGPSHHEVAPSVTDNGDGTYTVVYTPVHPGDHKVSVFLFDKPIKNTPVHVNTTATADAGKTTLEGPGLHGGQAEKPAHFKIIAHDPEGARRTDGGDHFEVKVEGGPIAVHPEIVDNHDGTYDVTYKAEEPGNYSLNVLHNGLHPVADCPRSITIKPAPSAEHCYAEGPGLGDRVFDNEKAEFTVHAVDKHGNPRTDGGDVFEVSLHGPHGPVHPDIRDNVDGTYTVSYDPTEVGTYNVDIKLDGKHIKGAPHDVHVREGTDAALSGFGSFAFTVTSKDKKGNIKTFGGDKFEVSITGPAEQIKLEAIDNNDGTYTGAYALIGTGRYHISVHLNGKAIEGSPFVTNVGSVKKDKSGHTASHTTSASAN